MGLSARDDGAVSGRSSRNLRRLTLNVAAGETPREWEKYTESQL